MTYEQIDYALDGAVLTITLNRPDKLNAYTPVMMRELIDAFHRADSDDAVRAIVVTGAGRAFCAGADLSGGGSACDRASTPMLADGTIDYTHDSVRDLAGRLTLEMFKSLKPVIAAINGPAVGVGLTMTLAMDIRLLADDAKIGMVFARRGILAEGASTYFLPRLVGLGKALEWSLSGRYIPAAEALASGLVNGVHPTAEVVAAAQEMARDMAANTAPLSVALTRQLLWQGLGWSHPMDAHRIESRGVYTLGRMPDAREGVASFLEKRAPQFTGSVSTDMPDFYPWSADRSYD